MDKSKNKKTGDVGERLAAEYLIGIGYKILDTNYNMFCGEIDILAKDKKSIVLVEVKTVRGENFGPAKGYVTRKKQQKLMILVKALEQEYQKSTIRIDVIGVHMHDNPPRIEHLINAVN